MPISPQFYCHSSEEMTEISDNTISLTITSPPYWNAIDYDVHTNAGSDEWYRTRSYSEGFNSYEEYLDLLTRVFKETLRVTKPGGFCAIIIGTVLMDGKHIPVPFDVTNRLTDIGWEFHQDIIWHKTTAGVKRAGSAIQNPYPGYFYPNIMTEYILLFRKPSGFPLMAMDFPSSAEKIYHTDGNREQSRFPIDDVFKMDIANNVWHIAPVPPRTINHPCPFPEEIPYRLISLYSYIGDVILDPFLGSGQTAKVAVAMGRNVIGYDTQQQYIDYAQSRLQEPLHIREKQLIATFKKIPLHSE